MEQFNFDIVADDFNNHLTGQLPWYNSFMDGMLFEIASYFVRKNSIVYDLGASTGNVQKRINSIILERSAKIIPIEQNKKMLDNYWEDLGVFVKNQDFTSMKYEPYSLATSILSLSFVHPHIRKNFIDNMKSLCEVGGGFLIVEKFENRQGFLGTLFNRISWANKIASGQPIEMVVNKELGLSGVQFPLCDSEVGGFDLIYAYGDFRAYLYRKE